MVAQVDDDFDPRSTEKGQEDSLCRPPLPQKLLDDLLSQICHYPGWKKDFEVAKIAFYNASETAFMRSFRKLKDKQHVYNEYRAFERLAVLAALDLSYEDNDIDRQQVEKWLETQPSNERTDMSFRDRLDGLRNKDQLFSGDRSHPNVKELDRLDLTYKGWEEDYRNAVQAHCTTPAESFHHHLHRLKQMQAVSRGDRSHWRLVELDKLALTYPGWEEDVAQIEDWHLKYADDENNKDLYGEVIEGLRDQEHLYLQGDEAGERNESCDKDEPERNDSSMRSDRGGSNGVANDRGLATKKVGHYDPVTATPSTQSLDSMRGVKAQQHQGGRRPDPEAQLPNKGLPMNG